MKTAEPLPKTLSKGSAELHRIVIYCEKGSGTQYNFQKPFCYRHLGSSEISLQPKQTYRTACSDSPDVLFLAFEKKIATMDNVEYSNYHDLLGIAGDRRLV